MTLANSLRIKLDSPHIGRRDIQVAADAWTAYLTVDRHDEIGCLVWELTLRRPSPESASLKGWAQSICARATGLLEKLTVYEVDDHGQSALLRSDAPPHRDGLVYFYEVHLHGAEAATLRRFQATEEPGQKRQQITFALTTEALLKFVEDVTAA